MQGCYQKSQKHYYLHSFTNPFHNPHKFWKIVQFTSNNTNTPLPAYVNGLTQVTDNHGICTAFNIILLHLVIYLAILVLIPVVV